MRKYCIKLCFSLLCFCVKKKHFIIKEYYIIILALHFECFVVCLMIFWCVFIYPGLICCVQESEKWTMFVCSPGTF